jgi:hypothetical protein
MGGRKLVKKVDVLQFAPLPVGRPKVARRP